MIKTIDILTLFPEMCEIVLSAGVIGRGIRRGLVDCQCIQIRDFSCNKHKRVDDAPYGGGGGMIMSAEPIFLAYSHVCFKRGIRPRFIFMSPKGKIFSQSTAKRLLNYENIAFLCGRYEGVDERVIDEIIDEKISIGEFVLSGGEIPALAVIDTILRMVPGFLPHEENFKKESHFEKGFLEHPQYTRPKIWHSREVPEVLLSGNHAHISAWKAEQSKAEIEKYIN
jgi:tRNA (guanine37-N1)-methyltransferase